MITYNITPPGMIMFGDFYKVLKYKILTCNLFCDRGCNCLPNKPSRHCH